MCRQCVHFRSLIRCCFAVKYWPTCCAQAGFFCCTGTKSRPERNRTLYLHYREKIPKEKTQRGNFFRGKFDLFFYERRKTALPCGFFSPLIPPNVTKGGL
ncbi:hypothetical protein HMPREF0262_02488 [Clostridium sp. ATCC 29733]|nr:hypothetical protein HMPREF0262_02488 [Clostridium sp. ATCC 29733]